MSNEVLGLQIGNLLSGYGGEGKENEKGET